MGSNSELSNVLLQRCPNLMINSDTPKGDYHSFFQSLGIVQQGERLIGE